MHPTTGEDKGTATGDKEEDLLPGEMYPPQDMEVPSEEQQTIQSH